MKKKVYLVSFILLLSDVFSKIIIKNTMNLYDSIKIIPNVFNITYVENNGAAFSILQGKQLFLCLVAILVLVAIIRYLNKEKLTNLKITYYSLLIAGIVGNLIDRIIYNNVVDFLDVTIFGYEIPIFNLADTFICISVGLIIYESVKGWLNDNKSR